MSHHPLMSSADLERYLHDHIPLSKAMGVSVMSVDESAVVLDAPLAPNINHRETAFGGSVSAIAILAAWGVLHVRTRREGLSARLVIQRNEVEYEQPIDGRFTSTAHLDEADWQRFARLFAKRGKARIAIRSEVESAGRIAARFAGEFVALKFQADDAVRSD